MDGTWELVEQAPAPALRPCVATYVGYRRSGGAPARHRGLPSPYLTMIIPIDDPLTLLAHPDPDQAPGDYWSLIGGLHLRPAMIDVPARQAGVQVAIRPLGARALFGLPAGELAHQDLAADAVIGSVAARLQDRVNSAASWPERFAAIDADLSALLREPLSVRAELAWSWHRLVTSAGTVRVRDLAAEVGLSARHLSETLRRETGLAPKAVARVVRFDHARRRIAGGGATIAEVAAECGYYDQAHLDRDFRDLAGCPPSQWLAEES